MKNCVLVGAPVDSGQKTAGCVMGPAAFRSAGLVATLAELGHRGERLGGCQAPCGFGVAQTMNPRVHAEQETVAWVNALAEVSVKAMGAGFPIFLGGDHSMAMGTVAGVAAHAQTLGRPLFVLWLDAHSDIHTPRTSQSGNYHGMPVAYFAGLAGFDAFPRFPSPIPARNICLFGIRSVDVAEQATLKAADFAVNDMRVLDERGIVAPLREFLHSVKQQNGMLHVSLDVDFLDPSIAPGVGTTVPGGATFREAHLVMELLHEHDLTT